MTFLNAELKKNQQPKILICKTILPFKNEEKIKAFTGKQTLTGFHYQMGLQK